MTLETELYGKLKAQYYQGGAWHDFGHALSIGEIKRSRRFSVDAGQSINAQKWRFIIDGAVNTDDRKVAVQSAKFWHESDNLSDVKFKTFTIDAETGQYLMAITENNIDFYQNGSRVGSANYGVLSEFLREVDVTQAVDTMIIFHKTYPQWAIMRQGTNFDWDFRVRQFENVPKYDFLGTRTGGINEKQQLRFVNYVNGDTFNLTIEEETTVSITWAGTASATISAIKTALENLKVIGVNGVTVTAGSSTNIVEIEFIGKNGNDDWAEIVPKTLKSDLGGIFTATIVQGEVGGEAKFSALRGYPSCGSFYAQRLWQGGLSSLPETLISSVVGDYFNLKIRNARPDGAIDITLDTDEVTAIRRIFPGRSLMIFTSSAEFYWSREPIDATAPGIKNTTRHGIIKSAPPVEVDGALFFIPKSACDILQVVWDEQQQTYSTQSIATLSAHLVTDIIDIAYRKRNNFSRPDLIILTKSNGEAIGASLMRSENMTGFFRIVSNGQFLCACGDDAANLYFGIRRNGKNRIEKYSNAVVDAAIVLEAGTSPITSLPNLSHLEGLEIVVIVDGEEIGGGVVSGGTINIDVHATQRLEIGIPFETLIETIPLLREGDRRGRASHKVQANGVEIEATTNARRFLVKTSGERWWNVNLRKWDEVILNQMALNDSQSGFVGRLEGIPGWDQYGKLSLKCTHQAAHIINSLIVTGVQ